MIGGSCILMRVNIINFDDIVDVIPNIEGDGIYSITIEFADGTCMAYAYHDKDGFRYDYKYLMDAWKSFGDIK